MIFYVEACFSGSMFDDWLPRDGNNSLNLYVVTAATPYESSYACYHDDTVKTYLGDCFSNHWMEDADNFTHAFGSRTFSEQFEAIVNNTWTSTPCQYGDTSLASAHLGEFESANGTEASRSPASLTTTPSK